MVTAPHHLAAASGASVLRDGGNAVEAMVAAAATIAVVYPHMNSIGGDGFWLIGKPGMSPVGIEACGRAAGLATPQAYRALGLDAIPTRGPLAANTVAGAVAGWETALKWSGSRLPVARLLDDALSYARDGTPVTQSQVDYSARFLRELAPQPGFGATFLRDGALPAAGSLQKLPALAATLERLARHGLDDFYRGEVAHAMAAELGRLGSPVRESDLAQHAARLVTPLCVDLSVGTAYNLPPPTQGVASLMILALFDRMRAGIEGESFDHVHRLVEATKQAFRLRNRHVADPDVMRVAPESWLTNAALDDAARAIDPRRAQPWPEPALKGDTVWMGACDRDGCMVSYIQSVYWEFGSGVVLEDTGVTWQNRGASFSLDPASHVALAPGRRPFHTLNPALARLSDGREMVYGNMGGDGQPQSQAAVFSRYAMFGEALQDAVSAPRWLLGRTWGDMSVTLKIESRMDASIVAALREAGHDVEEVEPWSDLVGHAGALVRHADGVIAGASDPRSDGAVVGL
ncbi:MAG TPA: gamma-glutamyltransferase family protein [Casimicrobiaceae bacterium]